MPVHSAIEALRELQDRGPQISDDLGLWLAPRAGHQRGIKTMPDTAEYFMRSGDGYRAGRTAEQAVSVSP